MSITTTELMEGVKLHKINTKKYKTNLLAIYLTSKLDRKHVTENALMLAILRRGTNKLKTQEDINIKLEELYGADFNCGIDKLCNDSVFKFYMESLNDEFLYEKENVLEQSTQMLFDIVFSPLTENGMFNEEYFNSEKENLRQIIRSRKDNKGAYAYSRCIEEMYKNEDFGLYKFGYIEDLEKINAKDLYNYYKELINTCKIDIFVSGMLDNNVEQLVKENTCINNLNEREASYTKLNICPKEEKKENVVTESMDVTQGKLIVGLDVNIDNEDLKYDTLIYNSILGGSANSKMFQNVREKAHLAYVASSSYMRYKSNIFIKCGIEIGNYEKTLTLVKKQIEDMEKGDFTEEEIENAKKGIIASIKTIDDEQDTQITYYFGQELTGTIVSLEEYTKKIENVSKEDIINIAKKVSINTIYFLRD